LGIDDHVRTLGALLIIFGLVVGLGAVAGLLAVGSPFALMRLASQAGTHESMMTPVLQVYGALLILMGLVLSVPAIVAGIALRRFRPWAREISMVVSSLMLIYFPIGTLLGPYGFWVMLSPEVEPLFSPRR
jgi:ABC-type antimicrobial peptide transport system permease subunit